MVVTDDSNLNQVDVPRPESHPDGSTRPRVTARVASWLIEQRAHIREIELESARLRGELDASSRVERGAQKVCDRLESELERSRQREARLAHALGYAEAQRDAFKHQLNAPAASAGPKRIGR